MGHAGWKPSRVVTSLETIHDLAPKSIVPARGPTIKGAERIDEVLSQHLVFLEDCQDDDGQVQEVGLGR